MKFSAFTFIFFLTFLPSITFASMSAESSKNSFLIRQNKKLERVEIQAKDGQWCAASKEYSGKNDDFKARLSLKIKKGKVYILSVSGEEITFFNAGLHQSVAACFDMIIEWEDKNLYIWGKKIGGKDKITNCEKIMVSYERCKNKNKDKNYRTFRAVVILRNYANKIQIKDVRNRECDTCWCHVNRLMSDDNKYLE